MTTIFKGKPLQSCTKVIILVGPPAVGKMTIGQELSKTTGFPLFHNHVTIEMLLPLFSYKSKSFKRLNNLFREEVFREFVSLNAPGFIFTYVWAFDLEDDRKEIEKLINQSVGSINNAYFIELSAPLPTRLERNSTPNRLRYKESKRDIEWSARNIKEVERNHILNSNRQHIFPFPERHIKINNTHLRPEEVSRLILEKFGKELGL